MDKCRRRCERALTIQRKADVFYGKPLNLVITYARNAPSTYRHDRHAKPDFIQFFI